MIKIDEITKRTERSGHKPFTVPNDYFAQLQQNIMSEIPDSPHAKVIAMKPRYSFLRPAITAVASVLVAVCGITVWLNNSTKDTATALLDSSEFNEMLSDADGAADYLMPNIEDYYTYLVQQ